MDILRILALGLRLYIHQDTPAQLPFMMGVKLKRSDAEFLYVLRNFRDLAVVENSQMVGIVLIMAAVAKRENEGSDLPGVDALETDAVGDIVQSMERSATLADSEILAQQVLKSLVLQSGFRSRGVKQAPFDVLREARIPAIVAEVGFLSHPQEAKLLLQCETLKGGTYVGPTIFGDVDPKARIAQEEIFGPVLSVIRARDFDHAVQIALDSRYGLTGGLFSRSPANIERVRREFRVGNLYVNRTCTGAIVERHPFGGMRMSGVGSKAGGPDYLIRFMESRSVSENMMRHGFTPDVS